MNIWVNNPNVNKKQASFYLVVIHYPIKKLLFLFLGIEKSLGMTEPAFKMMTEDYANGRIPQRPENVNFIEKIVTKMCRNYYHRVILHCIVGRLLYL